MKELLTSVEDLLAKHKVKAEFKTELFELLASYTKASNSSRVIHQPKEIDGLMHYYCRFHQKYYPENLMVMSSGKSKGYCKAAISSWNKTNAKIKKLESQASSLILAGDIDNAKLLAVEVELLKSQLNDPEYYNAEEDWANFKR